MQDFRNIVKLWNVTESLHTKAKVEAIGAIDSSFATMKEVIEKSINYKM